MPGSRSLVLLTVASVLVLALAAIGWCGGPVTPRAPGAEGMPPGPPPTGEAVPGNLTMAPSWIPTSTPNGANGVSPWVTYSILGLKQQFSWGFRATYEPELWGLDLALNFDWTHVNYKGDQTWFGITGLNPVLVSGNPAKSTFLLNAYVFSVDWGVSSLFTGPSSAIRVGPRVLFAIYTDELKFENSLTGLSAAKGRSSGMPGFGLVGTVDLAQWTGMGYSTSAGSARPQLKFAASIGQGSSMRFWEWEVFLRLFQTGGEVYALESSLPQPTFMFEVGFVRYSFTQTILEDAIPAVPIPGLVRDANANYFINIPTLRGSFVF